MSISLAWIFESLGTFYVIHGLISLVAAVIATYFLKKKFKDQTFFVILFFLMFNIVLVGVGYVLTAGIVYYLRSVQYETTLKNVNYINMIEFENEFQEINRIFGEASFDTLLSNDTTKTALPMKALVSLSENITKKNMILIKNSLSHKNDEVRLYSFAIIDKIERDINGKIHSKIQELQQSNNHALNLQLAEELSFLYWDLAYYKLSDKDLQKYILEEVKKYASMVLDSYPKHEKINILLGKVYLKEGEYDKAEVCFKELVSQKGETDYIIPYLAEIYFTKKDFTSLKKLKSFLNNVESFDMNEKLSSVIKQW